MTSRQRDEVEWQMRANDRDHKAKMEEERTQQNARIGKFESNLAAQDAKISENLQHGRTVTAAHQEKINKMNSDANELLREQDTAHLENKKELAKTANRELDSLQTSEAANQAAIVAFLSSEKKRIEESRRQANKEAAEKIENAWAQTSKASEIAHEHDKERTEYLSKVEKDQMSEIRVMKNQLWDNQQLEFQRLAMHEKKLEALKFTKNAATAQMDLAVDQMRKNRNASEDISFVTNEITHLCGTVNRLYSKVDVTHNLKKPDQLKKGYMMILKANEDIKTNKSVIEEKLGRLLELSIDDRDDERRSVIKLVLNDLKQLEKLYNGVNGLAPEEEKVVDMEFLDNLKMYTGDGAAAVDSLSRVWDTLPPVDRTNLIHASFLKTTSVLMDNAKLMAVEKPDVKALGKQ